jgi:sugar lactone lactonase YvrE
MIILFSTYSCSQNNIIEFDSTRWDLSQAKITEHLGRKCLIGYGLLKDVEFENGIIEVDFTITDGKKRSYPGIIFRVQSDEEYERFYIRPHRAGLYTDALQYVPSFHGVDSWQLYNGEGCTAGAEIPADHWIHIKIEVMGTQARVFLNNTKQPALFIKDLKHGVSKGSIGLMCPLNNTVFFSNLSLKIDNNLKFPQDITEIPLGIISDWEISQVFKANEIDPEKTPIDQGITDIQWQKVKSQSSGIVDLARYYGRRGADADCIWARTVLVSEKDEIKKLAFGYSDDICIFLNGKLLFNGNSAYQGRDPSFLGIVGTNDVIYLQLKKGNNELLILITESFGGWGFIFQDNDAIFQHASLTKQWELPRKFKYPESVVYDKKRNMLYVSNYFNNGKEFISKIKLNGEIETLEWIIGLNRPTGLFLYKDNLYTVDRKNLVEIDIESGKIINKFTIPDAVFPNDLAIDDNGAVYISDTERDAIIKFKDGKFETWLQNDEIKKPNGLMIDNNKLLIGNSGDGCVKSVNLSDKTIKTIICIGSGSIMDGIKTDGQGNYLISDYNGRVFRVFPSGETRELLNTKAPHYYCADFEYIPEKHLIIIPGLFDNRIMTYKINE